MTAPRVCFVVAMADNRVIGQGNDLPWHIPEDLKRFRDLTRGKPVIMGRKTFQSIMNRLGKPLPGRLNIVVTRGGFDAPEGVPVCGDLKTALDLAHREAAAKGLDEIVIGGGAQIYGQALPFADRLYLTFVHAEISGDAVFPDYTVYDWIERERLEREGDPAFSFVTLDRVR